MRPHRCPLKSPLMTVAYLIAIAALAFHGAETSAVATAVTGRSLQTLSSPSNSSSPKWFVQDLKLSSEVSPPKSNINTKDEDAFRWNYYRRKLDSDFTNVALPAFVGLAAEPVVSLFDGAYIGRLGAADQAGLGIALGAQYSVAKLYNDPLLKTSTSLVAGKEGADLSASVSTAIFTAILIGLMQTFCYLACAGPILQIMNVLPDSEMRAPAAIYLKWRAIGVPAATLMIVTNGIFRGRGDTKTPLYCTMLGHAVNILLDPILIFTLGMGVAGAGAANSISQWVAALPMLYLLNKSIPIQLIGRERGFFRKALRSYVEAGGFIFLRTLAKISTYTVTSAAAASLGTVPMAAYSMTFNLGLTVSQLCEAIAIASQALLARNTPFDTDMKKFAASHIINRSLLSGFVVSASLLLGTYLNLDRVLESMTKTPEVRMAARAVMPTVLLAQVIKGVSSSTGGILLGGLDWSFNAQSMGISSGLAIALVYTLPKSLGSIWVALTVFMAVQVISAGIRIFSGTGPWAGLPFSTKNTVRATSMIHESGRSETSPGF